MPDSKRKSSPRPGSAPAAKGKSTPRPGDSNNASVESRLDSIDAKLSKLLDSGGGGTPKANLGRRASVTALGSLLRTDDKFDVFVSHSKKLPESEDRAVWVADVVEGRGLVPFFDKSNLNEITTKALDDAVLRSDVIVTVLDPFTFNSPWVFQENLLAANAGIPIVVVMDDDRFRWSGQLDKWHRLYPWVFGRQVVHLNKSQRRGSVEALLDAIDKAAAVGRKPPSPKIDAIFRNKVPAKVGVGGSIETNTRGAVDTAQQEMLAALGGQQPSFIICAFTCTHEAKEVAQCVHELNETVPMIGCTTCKGVVLNKAWLTHKGVEPNKEHALAMWGLCDDGGAYITIHIEERPQRLRDEVHAQVSRAMDENGGEEGLLPSFVVLLGSPLLEEVVLDGLRAALGDEVPILGGSSADNGDLQFWRQIAKTGRSGLTVGAPSVSSNGFTIAIGWASCQTATTLTSGFNKTTFKAKVTKVEEGDIGRTILEVDEGSGSTPIRDVYEKWSKGAILKDVSFKDGVAKVLASSSFCPLGEVDGDYTRVMHPAFMHEKNGSLTTFADARVGMELTMLDAAPDTLTKLISTSSKGLITNANGGDASAFEPDEVIGALNIFCGGLVMALSEPSIDSMPLAAQQLGLALGHKATMGICCFGEQGMNHKRRACHGNLMFGCLLFSSKPRETSEASFKKPSGQAGQAHT